MCSGPLPCRYMRRRVDTNEEVIWGNAIRTQKRADGLLLALRVGQDGRQVGGLDAKRLKEAQTFCHCIFRHGMVMRNQDSVEERTWKACKCQAVFGATQVGQERTARIADQINDQIEALTTYLAP